jgi:hypothetical protein
VIRELLKKLPEYLRLQWTHDMNIQQLADWVSTQNKIVSKVEIGNEATQMMGGQKL